MSLILKFAFVAICLGVALFSYFFCHTKKDWLCLVLGLSFTLLADYFLILRGNHLYGVAIFCFAHVCNILRAFNGNSSSINQKTSSALGYAVISMALLTVFVTSLILESVIALAGVYAFLFVINIGVNILFYRNKETRLPKRNRALVLTGLILFALCDINVLLFNLPYYIGGPLWLTYTFPLIWVFYLPSQGLLAISGLGSGLGGQAREQST